MKMIAIWLLSIQFPVKTLSGKRQSKLTVPRLISVWLDFHMHTLRPTITQDHKARLLVDQSCRDCHSRGGSGGFSADVAGIKSS